MDMSRKAIPYTPNDKSLSDMKIAIVSTAGAHLKDDEPFNTDGDASYRLYKEDQVQTDQFTVTHGAPKEHYNTDEPKKDINVIMPFDRLRELADEGVIGGISNKHISMMGYAMRLKQILDETVPQVAKEINKSKADGVLLTAGWPLCHRTVVAVQRAIEAKGIPTVVVTLDTEQSGLMRPPRAIHPEGFEFGHSLGKPDDVETQKAVIKAALEQLVTPQEPGQIHDKQFPSY